ncbi:MAG: GTP-binding protein [Cyanobacteria bacterium J06659_2]
MGVWLVEALSRLYSSIAVGSPLLANLVLLMMVALILAAVAMLVYYGYLFLRPKRKRSRPVKPPQTKVEAADASLKAIRQQVNQIQDEVARQALIQQSHRLEASYSQGIIKLVVFGTGSAGKTSLVNALVGQVVGEVGAPLGTTDQGETYRLDLPDIAWQLWITDTPGLLEAGDLGADRAAIARQLAADADLLLFVIDNDLPQSEFQVLAALVNMGKRSLLILNKRDRYLESDLNQLLARVRSRLGGLIAPMDIVAIAAQPQPLQLESGDWFQSDPELWPLLDRLTQVLREEGANLVADNLLLQSQRIAAEARRLISSQRQTEADKILDRYQWIGAGVIAVTPLPGLDLLATAAINAQMVVDLGRVYGCQISIEEGKTLALSLAKTLTGLGIVKGAVQLLSIGLQTNLTTVLAGRAIQGVSGAYLTRIAGKSFMEYFRQNQDWGDGGMTEVVRQQFQLNRRDAFVKAFVQSAIDRVVLPLRDTLETK